MKSWEAVRAMEEGKKVTRPKWDDDEFLMIDEEYDIVNKEGSFYAFDCKYNDWTIYEEKKDADEKLKQLFQILNEDNWFANNQYGEYIYDNNLVDHMTSLYMQLMEMAKYYKLD